MTRRRRSFKKRNTWLPNLMFDCRVLGGTFFVIDITLMEDLILLKRQIRLKAIIFNFQLFCGASRSDSDALSYNTNSISKFESNSFSFRSKFDADRGRRVQVIKISRPPIKNPPSLYFPLLLYFFHPPIHAWFSFFLSFCWRSKKTKTQTQRFNNDVGGCVCSSFEIHGFDGCRLTL